MKLTSLCCGSGAAERNWKVYKGICTKERSRLGQLKKMTFAAIVDGTNMDVDEEEEEAQTSATKLIFVKGNLHCAEYNDYVLSDAENELRSFDAYDSAGPLIDSSRTLTLTVTHSRTTLAASSATTSSTGSVCRLRTTI